MAVLQAWPGRGFWQGGVHGRPGTMAAMVASMTSTPQPRFLSSLLRGFQSSDAAHGGAVNLLAVLVLAGVGAALLTGSPRIIRPALVAGGVFGLATWVLVQDLGFLGGLGTDPNSMIPFGLLVAGCYVAMQRPAEAVLTETVPAETVPADTVPADTVPAETVPAATAPAEPVPATPVPEAVAPAGAGRPARLLRAFGGIGVRALLAIWAAAVVLVGAAPMVMAQTSSTADPIIAQAIDGNWAPLDFPAPAFTLTDQNGHSVSLASLHGKVILLTFLDPVCTSDCPQIAQEFRAADGLLSADSSRVELVAIVANPLYRSVAYTRAFDDQEYLSGLRNWLYLTGSLPQLEQVWKNYAIAAQILPAGGMIAHSDVAYVIDGDGRTRGELDFDPGPGTETSESSFAVELQDAAQQFLQAR
jgi:cytochrome oxidase Cu insertion factor (SCO1/SenC/PrrC family)